MEETTEHASDICVCMEAACMHRGEDDSPWINHPWPGPDPVHEAEFKRCESHKFGGLPEATQLRWENAAIAWQFLKAWRDVLTKLVALGPASYPAKIVQDDWS